MTAMNRFADQFCDLGGFDAENPRPVLFAHDGSDVTLVEIMGTKSIVSDDEYVGAMINRFAAEMAQIMKSAGHNIIISYESSYNAEQVIDRHLARQRHNAELKQLRVDTVLEETRAVLLKRALNERIVCALVSRPQAANNREIMAQKKERDKAVLELPAMKSAMNPYLEFKALDAPHRAFVSAFLETLGRCNVVAKVIGPDEHGARADLAAIRQGILYHETPDDWVPHEAGAVKYPPMKGRFDSDVSDFFAQPLAKQILSSAPTIAPDMRRIAWGTRQFSVCQVLRFPKNLRPFNILINRLNRSKQPYRITLHLEALNQNDKSKIKMRQVFAQLLGIMNGTTKLLGKNLRVINDALNSDEEAVVRANIVATTWIEPGEREEELPRRASTLMSAIQSWGDCTVSDSPSDPARTLTETVAGMTATAKSWRGTLAPISDLSVIMPFHRTAPIFDSGDSLFTSLDGNLMPHRAFAPEQPAWLTLVSAGMGSGKSVLTNRMNFDLCAYRSGSEMPFLMVADVGVSSSGCMNLLRALLPAERQGEVMYIRPQNTVEYAVNPFEISLGCRAPLDREQVFIHNFLMTAIPMKDELLPQLITRIIGRVFEIKSDISMDSKPNRWQANVDPDLNDAARAAGIELSEKTRYWTLVDEFMRRGNYKMAQRAQRYAVPRMKDIATVIADPQMKVDFDPRMIENLQRHLESIESQYPMFTSHTRLDTGPARVMAVDLQDLVSTATSEEVMRKNTLMFLATRQIFIAKIAGHRDDLPAMTFPKSDPDLLRIYNDYWTRQFTLIAETPKRLMMDEYHLTGNVDYINRVVEADCRTGRKWNLEVVLVSQKLPDFNTLTAIASTVFVLNSDSAESREQIMKTMGGTEAVDEALMRHVNGPDKTDPSKGANVLAMYKLRNDEQRWVIFNNALGIRLLWALSTKAEDRAVRDELYSRVSFERALDLLARRFPEGTALPFWEDMARRRTRASDKSLASAVVDEIMKLDMAQPLQQAAE